MNDNQTRLILNVDDNDVGRYTITRILQQAGFKVQEAATGSEALRFAEECPDLILLEVKLPDISGIEVCRQIRINQRTASIPVVHLSAAYVGSDDLALAIDQGADGYLTHPVHPKVLVATVNAFLRLKRAEQTVRASEKRYRRLFESAQDGIVILDAETGKIVDANPFILRLLGYSYGEVYGKCIWELGVFKDNAASMDAFKILQDHEYIRYENLPLETRNGEQIAVEFVSNVYFVDEQKVIQCNIRDVTTRRQMEEALRESEERFRSLYENSTIGLYRTTPDGKVLLANHALVKMLGYPSFERLASRNLNDEGYEPTYERKNFIHQIEAHGEIKEFESAWTRDDGSILCVSESARAQRDANGKTMYYDGTVKDITERKRTEERLRQSEQTYRGILNSITDGVSIKDENGLFLDVNRAIERMYGYTNDEFVGRTQEFISAHGKNDLPKLEAYLEKSFHGEPQSFEFWGQRKDGTVFPVEISHSLGEYFGKKVIIAVSRDITERKAIDQLLRDVQRRESIGVLSSGIAHDFNNLLAAMMGNVSLAQMQLPAHHRVQKNMAQALSAMETAAELVQQILAYSGKGKYDNRTIDLGEEIKKHVSLFRVSMPKNVKLTTDLPSVPVYVNGDPGQIKQIIMNLIMNGGEAIGEKHGVVSIILSAAALGNDELRKYEKFTNTTLNGGAYALLEISDTGIGMDPDTIHAIFDPFFTTKFIGRGLGLAAALGIIRGHEGGIAVESTEGIGTKFSIVLPLAAAPEMTHKFPAEKNQFPEATTTILVIDDEENVAAMAGEVLESGKYTVLTELNPIAGIEHYKRHQSEIGLLLLDLTMPEMSGIEVVDILHAINPGVKIIISSGYTEHDIKTKMDMTKVSGFIQKPYTPQSLLAIVKVVLR
jgi:two-component system, cell cycle sensor histidine kinase and response regulator CckA